MNRSALGVAIGLLGLACGGIEPGPTTGMARDALERDLEGFATSSCLAELDDAALKDQGASWAGAIIQRSHGGIEPFGAIARTVSQEMQKILMEMGRDESNPRTPKPLPIMYCAEMIDVESVRASITRAAQELSDAYAQRAQPTSETDTDSNS